MPSTSGVGPNPDKQPNPNPNSPPGAPAATPIPASTIISSPTNTPEGQAKVERYRRYIYNSTIGLTILIPLVIAAPPRKLDLWTYGLGIAWANSVSYIVEEKTGKGLLWHIGTQLPSEANRLRKIKTREDENKIRRDQGLPERKGGFIERVWMGGESDDWIEKRARLEKEALEEGGKGYSGLIMDQVREVLGFRKFEDDLEEEEETYGKKD